MPHTMSSVTAAGSRALHWLCAVLGEVRWWKAVGLISVIAIFFLVAPFDSQRNQTVSKWQMDKSLTGGTHPEAGALPVLMLMPAFSSQQARSHYRQQLWSLVTPCHSALSLHLVTPAQHKYELEQLLDELLQVLDHLQEPDRCRLRYTVLRGAEEMVGGGVDEWDRGRRLLGVLQRLAPLGRVVFLDEQVLPAADLSPLLAELANFAPGQLAAAAPEDTARFLSSAELRGAELPEPGVSGRLLLLDLPRLAAEPELRRLLAAGGSGPAPLVDSGLQPDAGALLTLLRRRRPELVALLPCQWTVTQPDQPRVLDQLFACPQTPLVISTAGRREADWERAVREEWQERQGDRNDARLGLVIINDDN